MALVLVLLAGGGAALFWGNPARLVASSTAVDLGPVAVGETSEPIEVVLSNDGGRAARIGRLDLFGPLAGEFEIGATDCFEGPIEPGASCRLSLAARPAAPGDRRAELRVDSDAEDLRLAVSVRGAVARLVLEPGRLDFGEQTVGTVGVPAELRVVNSGNAPATVERIRRRGGAPDDYLVYRDSCTGSAVEPGGECAVRFGFRPSAPGRRDTTLLVVADDGGPPLEGELRGVGTGRPVSLSFEPAAVDLGGVETGRTVETALRLRNVGRAAVERLTLSVEPTVAGLTVAPGGCTRGLAPGADCRATLRFSPTGDGPIRASVVVEADGTRAEIPATGSAWASSWSVSPQRIAFGEIPAGQTTGRTLEIRNDGRGASRVGSPLVEGPAASAVKLDQGTCSGDLAPGATCRVTVEVRPSDSGALRARVRWPRAPGLEVDIVGDARRASIDVGPARIDFGEVPVGRSEEATVVVTNRSVFEISVDGTAFIGSSSLSIAEDGCAGRRLATGARCGIRIRFAPMNAGPSGGEVVLPLAASDGRQRIPVAARGI